MKILTYISGDGREKAGYLSEDGRRVIAFADAGIDAESVNELIDRYSLEEVLAIAGQTAEKDEEIIGELLENVVLQAPVPVPKQDIICLGINYLAHKEESARYKKEAFQRDREYPIYFAKRVNRALGPGMAVDSHRDMFENLDYEAELAVVTGRRWKNTGICRNVAEENAPDHIFGYTIVNDISAREIQTRHKQWYFGKSLDDFTPMGPWIVTADEINWPPALDIRSYVNGELRQNSNTSLLINDIGYIFAELTQGMTLLPASIISTGTPAGVGMGQNPPEFMKSGDEVCCEIENIGQLSNVIK